MTIRQPRIAFLPDTPDARLLVALTSHASDLSEASHALASAFAAGEDSELWFPLTSHAVTAYVRPFIHSNVRKRLDKRPGIRSIPPSLEAIHDVIRQHRNRTIAHSHSSLALPLAVAFLDGTGHGDNVAGVSVIHPMPMAIAEGFAGLIRDREDAVQQAIQPVQQRLREWLKCKTAEEIGGWDTPEFIHAADEDFNARNSRSRTPRFAAYWKVEKLPTDEPLS